LADLVVLLAERGRPAGPDQATIARVMVEVTSGYPLGRCAIAPCTWHPDKARSLANDCATFPLTH
jgi:hypothetical protein